MIRNPAEYAQALARLADERKRLDDRARLKQAGLTDADIEKLLGPVDPVIRELQDEVGEYERFMPPTAAISTGAAPGTRITRTKQARKGKMMPRRKGKTFGPGSRAAKAGKRRKFSLEDKRRIIAEIDAAPMGSKGAVAEKYKVYSKMLAYWRKQLGKSRRAATTGRPIGRRRGRPRKIGMAASAAFDSTNLVDLVKENSALRAEVAGLRSTMEQVKRFVQIQRQLAGEMLGAE